MSCWLMVDGALVKGAARWGGAWRLALRAEGSGAPAAAVAGCGALRVAYGSAPRPLSPPTIPTVRSSRNVYTHRRLAPAPQHGAPALVAWVQASGLQRQDMAVNKVPTRQFGCPGRGRQADGALRSEPDHLMGGAPFRMGSQARQRWPVPPRARPRRRRFDVRRPGSNLHSRVR